MRASRCLTCFWLKSVPLFDSSAYIYIYCRKGIWSGLGGDLVPQRLPAAEPRIFTKGKPWKFIMRKTGGFPRSYPPGTGTKFPPQPLRSENALENRDPNFSETTIFIVVSCSSRPFFSGRLQKYEKDILQRVLLSEVVFEGGVFVQFALFCFSLIFTWIPFCPFPSKDRLETPIFIVFL